MMLLVEISWAGRVWALPFLTVLAPSERYSQQYKLRHKKLIDWARQMMFQVKRWLPTRELVGATRFSEVGQKRVMMLALKSAIATQIPGVIENVPM